MAEPIPVRIPVENVNDETVTLLAWLVANGEKVDEGQALAEVESSKAAFEIFAPEAGYVRTAVEEGQDIHVRGVLCYICDAPAACEPAPEEIAAADQAEEASPQATRLSRQALALIEERGLDRNVFASRGLVRERDVLQYLGEAAPAVPGVEPAGDRARDKRPPVPAAGVPFRTEALPRGKRTEAKYLRSASQNTLPSVVTIAVPVLPGVPAAEEASDATAARSAVLIYEVARLLRKYPAFNAFYADGAAHFYEQVNVGFALDADHGLRVPVIHHADAKSVQDIATELRELLVSYLEEQLPVEALAGGTFTVTDLSGEDVTTFHPLLNQGQSAILGIGAPWLPPGSPAGVYYLMLGFDHQLSEGRGAAQFLRELRERLDAHERARQQARGADAEPRCARCLAAASRLHAAGHVLLLEVRPDGTSRPVCSICSQGW